MTRYAWSRDEETYYGDFATIDEAFDDAESECCTRPWIGERYQPPAEECIYADLVLDHIAEQDEYSLDCADGWPSDTKEQRAELTAALQAVLREWLDRHDLRGFFLVRDAKQYQRDDGAIVAVKRKGGA